MSRVPQIRVVQASDAKAIRRTLRRPQHPFNVRSMPFEVTPFLMAPVLPGDTMVNLLAQARVISDPVNNPIIGWWYEQHYFYVPLRSMIATGFDADFDNLGYGWGQLDREKVEQMFTTETMDLATYYGAAANTPENYAFKGGVDWMKYALGMIVGEFFRDENDQYNHTIDKYPAAYLDRRNGFQSIDAAAGSAHDGRDAQLPGEAEEEAETHTILGAADDGKYDEWLILRDAGMTSLGFDDYLREQGVSVPRAEDTDASGQKIVRPELLRSVRKWTYPTNHIDPTDGTPTSAVSWSCVERADKHRLFREPGFIVGVSVVKPKLYLGSQKGSLSGLLTNWLRWPSTINADRPYRSLVQVTHSATDGPLQNQTNDYWLDVKDLFLYGEQFVNFAMDAAANHGISVPGDRTAANYDWRVPTKAQVQALFVDSTGAGGKTYIRQDGVVHLGIKSRLGSDTTPGGG